MGRIKSTKMSLRTWIIWSDIEIDGYGSLYSYTRDCDNGSENESITGLEIIAYAIEESYEDFSSRLDKLISYYEKDNMHGIAYVYCAKYGQNKWSCIISSVQLTRTQIFQSPINEK